MTLVLRHHRLGALALERPGVLAVLRMVLACEEGTEESTAGLELPTAVWAPEGCNLRQVVRGGDERARVDFVERLLERLVDIPEHTLPIEPTSLAFVAMLIHIICIALADTVMIILFHLF